MLIEKERERERACVCVNLSIETSYQAQTLSGAELLIEQPGAQSPKGNYSLLHSQFNAILSIESTHLSLVSLPQYMKQGMRTVGSIGNIVIKVASKDQRCEQVVALHPMDVRVRERASVIALVVNATPVARQTCAG